MSKPNLILIEPLCIHYEVELSFFQSLDSVGLIDITVVENTYYIQEEKISDVEKMVRLHHDLNLNLEAIDVVFNLLNQIDTLQEELTEAKNRLRVYEDWPPSLKQSRLF